MENVPAGDFVDELIVPLQIFEPPPPGSPPLDKHLIRPCTVLETDKIQGPWIIDLQQHCQL